MLLHFETDYIYQGSIWFEYILGDIVDMILLDKFYLK